MHSGQRKKKELKGWKRIYSVEVSAEYPLQFQKHTMTCDSWDAYANRYVKVSDMMKELEEKCGVETAWQEMESNLREVDSKNRYISVDLAVKTLLDAGYEEPAALVMKKWQDNREE